MTSLSDEYRLQLLAETNEQLQLEIYSKTNQAQRAIKIAAGLQRENDQLTKRIETLKWLVNGL